jgi:hypothetical protein
VSEGQYTLPSLLTALASALNSAGSNVTFSFTTSTNLLKVTIIASDLVIIGNTPLSRSLGFVEGQEGSSIVGTNAYSIVDPYVFIRFNNLHTNMAGHIHGHFRIPITQDAGYMEFFNAVTSSEQHFDLTGVPSVSQLQVSLVDQHGNDLSLNGVEFSFLIRIDHD